MSHIDTLCELGRWHHHERQREAERAWLAYAAQQGGGLVSRRRWSAPMLTRLEREVEECRD